MDESHFCGDGEFHASCVLAFTVFEMSSGLCIDARARRTLRADRFQGRERGRVE